MKELTAFRADDGRLFENEEDCKFYEEAIDFMSKMRTHCEAHECNCDSCIFCVNGTPCHFEKKGGYAPEYWEF